MNKHTPGTNYPGHEELYLRRRKEGALSWDSEEGTHQNIEIIEKLCLRANLAPLARCLSWAAVPAI